MTSTTATENGGTPGAAVGLSGGVDSAVALYLLRRRGYRVAGVTLRMLCLTDGAVSGRECCSIESMRRAARFCERLGVPHYIIDVERRFRELVIGDAVRQYRRGRTPNPCIVCNEKIKFPALAGAADRLGLSMIATGHHARIVRGPRGTPHLAKAADPGKDQSYVLYRVPVSLLGRTCFPVGNRSKDAVRRLAADAGFGEIASRESQDICFVPDGDLDAFFDRYIKPSPGDVVDSDGTVLGRHRGIFRYTIGQRRGLGIAGGEPLYVKRIDARRREIVLSPDHDLYASVIHCRNVRLRARTVSPPLEAKIRYRHAAAAVRAVERDRGRLVVAFATPQRAPAPGQSLVLYRGDVVVGGGIIDGADG